MWGRGSHGDILCVSSHHDKLGRSRMFPAWPRMLPSCAPQVPPMSLVCRPQVLRMFPHVPCERFACSLLHPHVIPYVPACSRVFTANSPPLEFTLHWTQPLTGQHFLTWIRRRRKIHGADVKSTSKNVKSTSPTSNPFVDVTSV